MDWTNIWPSPIMKDIILWLLRIAASNLAALHCLEKKCGSFTPFTRKVYSGEVTVIPTKIEISSELDQFVRHEILDKWDMTYPRWIEKCYVKRMEKIFSDPTESVFPLTIVAGPAPSATPMSYVDKPLTCCGGPIATTAEIRKVTAVMVTAVSVTLAYLLFPLSLRKER